MPNEPVAEEKLAGREITVNADGLGATTEWLIFHTDDPTVALNLLPKYGDQYNLDGVLLDTFVDNISLGETENQSPRTMTATITYAAPKAGGGGGGGRPDTASWSLSIATESVNVQQAIAQTNWPADPGYLTIGEDVDGEVIGVDILSPAATLKVNHWLNDDDADAAFLDRIQAKVAAKLNDAAFNGPWGNWKAEEALYLGVEASYTGTGIIQLSHQFKRSVEGIVEISYVENNAVVPAAPLKKGWQYFWGKFGSRPNQADPKEKPKTGIITAHIADVYKKGDFGLLKLPTEFIKENE